MAPKNYHSASNSGSPGYDQEREDKHINKIAGSPSQYENFKKLHLVELLISFREYYQYNWKILPKRGNKNQIHEMHIITSSHSLHRKKQEIKLKLQAPKTDGQQKDISF